MNSGKKNKDYARRVLDVKNALPGMIEAEKQRTGQYLSAYEKVSEDKLLISEIKEQQRQRAAKQTEIREDLAKKKSYVFLLDFGCGFFGFLFTYFLASVRVAFKKELDTRTVFSAISLVFASWEKRLIYRIEKWANVDIDGDGHISDPPVEEKAPVVEGDDIFTMLENSQKADAKKELASIEKARKEAAEFNRTHHNPAAVDYLRNRDKAPGMNGHGHGDDGKKKI